MVALLLGFVYGLQYNMKIPGICYESLELNLIVADEVLELLQNEIYLPWNWGNLGLAS